jgi:hypothetical protein
MMKRIERASPRHKGRIKGLFYLLTMLTGIFTQCFVSARLVVSGDAATTATNMLAHESLFRLGFTVASRFSFSAKSNALCANLPLRFGWA